ncbi:adenylate cyclase CyaB-like [Pecten maximus]|uniref:adenylate cyclase CyaB-like n=1 Tax=Pecten maximus TaxID=6579 RepID=UPI0014580C0E|nr:adenylate cyclase CyaB-like [Pecten maximus]
MPGNVEIKAKLHDVEGVKKISAELSQSPGETLVQEDVFFFSPNGRLKLRTIKDVQSELIFYDRPDKLGPKFSDYSKTDVVNPESLKETLRQAMGIKGVVKKVRKLYMVGQTRVHVDHVEGLGDFMELEVMMEEGQTAEEGQKIAENLMDKLGVKQSDLLSGAYMDMILQKSDAA